MKVVDLLKSQFTFRDLNSETFSNNPKLIDVFNSAYQEFHSASLGAEGSVETASKKSWFQYLSSNFDNGLFCGCANFPMISACWVFWPLHSTFFGAAHGANIT